MRAHIDPVDHDERVPLRDVCLWGVFDSRDQTGRGQEGLRLLVHGERRKRPHCVGSLTRADDRRLGGLRNARRLLGTLGVGQDHPDGDDRKGP